MGILHRIDAFRASSYLIALTEPRTIHIFAEPWPDESQPVHEPVPSAATVIDVINGDDGNDGVSIDVGDFAVGQLLAGTDADDAKSFYAAESSGSSSIPDFPDKMTPYFITFA